MSRVQITKVVAPGNYPTAGVVVTETVGDATNFNQYLLGIRDVLIVRNTDSVDHAVTIQSSADPQGRLGDITDTVTAGTTRAYGPLVASGWQQVGSQIFVNPSSNMLVLAVISVP